MSVWGSIEVQAAIAAHDRSKIDLLLGSLGSSPACCAAQMDRAGAQSRVPLAQTADGSYDTPANRRFLDALRQALYSAREVDAERAGTEAPAADLVLMLIADVSREIFGPPVQMESLFGKGAP